MEEHYVWEPEDTKQPSTTEETIMAMIFTECDTEGTGNVPALKLIHYMLNNADQKLDRSLLNDLQQMLDPQGLNVDVTRQTFETAMKDWTEKVENKVNISCLDHLDSCRVGVTEFVQGTYSNQTSPLSKNVLECDLNISSSCGSSEAGNVPPTVETNNLAECVMELKHAKKRLEDQNKDLQIQIQSIENSYAMLQRNYKDKCDKLCSTQSSVEQNHQLQKECEDLKDAKSAAEEHLVVLKTRVQQLEKVKQLHDQQLSSLENQQTELAVELEMSKKKNQELQKLMIVQKMENEQLLKYCSRQELLSCKQSDTISDMEDKINDLLSHIKNLQEENQSLQVSLESVKDEYLSANSQSPCDITKRIARNKTTAINGDGGDEDEYPSAASSLFWSMEDKQTSLLSEFEAVNETPVSNIDTVTPNTSDVQEFRVKHLKWKIIYLDDQAPVSNIDTVTPNTADVQEFQEKHPKWKVIYLDDQAPVSNFDTVTPNTADVQESEVKLLILKVTFLGHQMIDWEVHLESLNQEVQNLLTDVGDVGQHLQSIVAHAMSDSSMTSDEQLFCEVQKTSHYNNSFESSLPGSDIKLSDKHSTPLFHPVTELEQWFRKTNAPAAIRRKPNQQARAGGVSDVLHMENPELSEQVVASVNGGSSVSSDASSSSTDVFPSLTNGVLQQLRLDATASASDVFSDQDIENKFCALALAFKTDKLTLVTRHDRQQRQRDQTERNMAVEIRELKAAVLRLNYVCKDSESIEILGRIQDQVDILKQSTELVSTSAEIFGAVQQEIRVSKAIEVMLTHVENLKRMFEKEHAELEETKRVLLENNLVLEGNADSADDSPKNPRHRMLISLSRQGKQKRRASIAVFRPLNSQESMKTSNASPTFGDTKRGVPHSRRSSSSSQLDTPSPTWERKDRLERTESVVGSMDGIKEMAEGWGNDSVNSDEQSTIMEENNNCKGIHKSSHCDSPPAVAGGDITYSSGNTVKNPAQSGEANEDCTKDSSSPSLMQNLDSLRSFRDTAVEFVCRTHVTIVDSVTSLNTDYVLIQLRRCATLLLLFAAFWSLVSTFVPTTAQPRSCTPFSWLTLKDVLDKIAQLEHYGTPPT